MNLIDLIDAVEFNDIHFRDFVTKLRNQLIEKKAEVEYTKWLTLDFETKKLENLFQHSPPNTPSIVIETLNAEIIHISLNRMRNALKERHYF